MSTENVSWSTPFGDSALGQLGGVVKPIVQTAVPMINLNANSVNDLYKNPFQDVSTARPFGNSALGSALQGNPNSALDANGRVKETGEQLVNNPDAPPGAGVGLPTSPRSSFGGANNDISFGGDNSPRSALALEERLRSEARKRLNPNVEYNFNLEANPLAKQAPKF